MALVGAALPYARDAGTVRVDARPMLARGLEAGVVRAQSQPRHPVAADFAPLLPEPHAGRAGVSRAGFRRRLTPRRARATLPPGAGARRLCGRAPAGRAG